MNKRHAQVVSCNALVRKKIAARMQDAMMPLGSVSHSAGVVQRYRNTHMLPVRKTKVRLIFRAVESLSLQTIGIGRQSMSTSVMIFGRLAKR